MTGFPWDEAMAFGLGVLKLPPRQFWAMTPRELARAMEGAGGRRAVAPDRPALEELMAAYPDTEQHHG